MNMKYLLKENMFVGPGRNHILIIMNNNTVYFVPKHFWLLVSIYRQIILLSHKYKQQPC